MKKHLHHLFPFSLPFFSFLISSLPFSSVSLSTPSLNHQDKVKKWGWPQCTEGRRLKEWRKREWEGKEEKVRKKGREWIKRKRNWEKRFYNERHLNVFHSENEEGSESAMALFEHMRTLRCLRCRGMSQGGNPIAPHIQTCQLWEQWEGGGDEMKRDEKMRTLSLLFKLRKRARDLTQRWQAPNPLNSFCVDQLIMWQIKNSQMRKGTKWQGNVMQ